MEILLAFYALEKGFEYWLGLHNFYVITRYNHSAMYAMSVYQLSLQLAQRFGESVAQLDAQEAVE